MKTKVYQFSLKEREKAAKILDQVANLLQNGAIVPIPTETCYSIAIDATNDAAAKRLNELGVKPGPTNPIIVSDLRMAAEYMSLNPLAEKITHAFMPGPVTLVVDLLPDTKLSKNVFTEAASFRISSNTFTRALASELGKPITVSILADKPPLYKFKDLFDTFNEKVEAIVGSGDLPQVMPSTVVDVRKAAPALIRQGPVPFSEITDLAVNLATITE